MTISDTRPYKDTQAKFYVDNKITFSEDMYITCLIVDACVTKDTQDLFEVIFFAQIHDKATDATLSTICFHGNP